MCTLRGAGREPELQECQSQLEPELGVRLERPVDRDPHVRLLDDGEVMTLGNAAADRPGREPERFRESNPSR